MCSPDYVEISWTFTAETAVSTTNGLTVTYASGDADIEDSEGADWYLLEGTAPDGGGIGYRFHRVMTRTDRLLNTAYINGANLGTVTLCRV